MFGLLFCLPEKILKEYVNIACFDVTECVSVDRDETQAGKFFQLAKL